MWAEGTACVTTKLMVFSKSRQATGIKLYKLIEMLLLYKTAKFRYRHGWHTEHLNLKARKTSSIQGPALTIKQKALFFIGGRNFTRNLYYDILYMYTY